MFLLNQPFLRSALAALIATGAGFSVLSDTSAVAHATDSEATEPDAIAEAFGALVEDPAPAQLVRSTHYFVSNENSHYLFRDAIADQGGVFVGVGTDQVYLLAGWAKPEVIVPMDFDAVIRDLHFVYGAAFIASETKEDFYNFFRYGTEQTVRAALVAAFGEENLRERLTAWRAGRNVIKNRLWMVRDFYQAPGSAPTMLTDDATYAFLRERWQDGRVFPMRGDLEGEDGMQSIARAAQATGLAIGSVYLSNVEQYVEYNERVRRNLLVLPRNERSLVLRTRPMSVLGLPRQGENYHYNYQPLENAQQWMRWTRIADGRTLLIGFREAAAVDGVSSMSAAPEPAAQLPTLAPAAAGLSYQVDAPTVPPAEGE